jgi:immunity protein, SdpI family
MTGKYYYVAGILLTAAALVATVVAYPHLPGSVPTHWNIYGLPDGYGPKWELYLLGPGLMAGTLLLTRLLPWLSPRPFEVESFRSTYIQIMLIMVGMWAYLDAVTLWSALGHSVNAGRAILGGVCLLFALLGNVMGKVRRNFYIGVRTPWALASERVWNATHRLAAKTFVLGGLAGLALIALGLNGWPPFVALMAGALVPAVYSLVFSKRLERRGEV